MINMSDNKDRVIRSALYTAVLNKLSGELSELEAKIGEAKNIIDVTPEEITSE